MNRGTCSIADKVAPRGLIAQRGRVAQLQRDAALHGRRQRRRPQPERQPARQVKRDHVHVQRGARLQR